MDMDPCSNLLIYNKVDMDPCINLLAAAVPRPTS